MNCSVCALAVSDGARFCPGCGEDVGFPNVRLAESAQERHALGKRVSDAEISMEARSCRDVLEQFGAAASKSQAVIARNLQRIQYLVNSESSLYINYYQEVRSGARIPEDNEWDRGRAAADSTVSPHYFEQLIFGALSLNGKGIISYGPYSMVLRDNTIERRATVFEENPFVFCKRHKISSGQPAKLGYRATWADRHLLAKAKLHSQLSATTKPEKFPEILLKPQPPADEDFIEVHIYGQIHRNAIECVIGPMPKRGVELIMWKSVKKKLEELGARMEVG